MRIDTYIKGAKEAISKIQLVEDLTKDVVIKKALLDSSLKLQEAVRDACPKDTGNLKNKIGVKVLRTKSGATYTGILVGADINGLKGTMKTEGGGRKKVDRPAYYLVMLIKGYYAGKRHTRTKHATHEEVHGGHEFVEGHDFLTPVMERLAPEIVADFERVFESTMVANWTRVA